jgi:predicted PurR-regulated permease PerM
MSESRLEISPVAHAASVSLRIIAAAIVVAAINYASSVVITLICAVFIAFVLEPGVRFLEKVRIPRWIGSLAMVLLALTIVYLAIYGIYDRVLAFIHDFPSYAEPFRHLIRSFRGVLGSIQQGTSSIIPNSQQPSMPTIRLQQESPWVHYVLRGVGSVYTFAITVMFIPFLVFFMLASKDKIWASTLNLFVRERRQQAEEVIQSIGQMVREYVIGNILVALISAALITPVFYLIHLRYALLLGPIAAVLSLIPYLGVALAIIPPLLVALGEYAHIGPFVAIGITVMVVHFLAMNFLTPKLVGHRVKLNALTVTVSMMFWAWLWGGIGLVLAVPITAALKAVCDNVEKLKPWGAWMGEG